MIVSQKARLVLVDHMCVLPYGHNLNALVLFQNALKSHFSASFCLASRYLPSYAEQGVRVERVLSYPYGGLAERALKKEPNDAGRPSNHGGVDYARLLKLIHRNAQRAFYTGFHEATGYDFMRHRTRRDWRKIFKRYEIGADEVIFFPSADYYGCLSLLDVVRQLPDSRMPRIHFRFIGVMESASYSFEPSRPVFFAEIRKAIRAGAKITLSAETTKYATYVERLLGVPVTYMPYPLANEQEPLNWGQTKIIASPGQGRQDKGFFQLFAIISRLRRIGSNGPFRFDVQNMRRTDREFRARYESILKNIPNMHLRPERLRQEEIDGVYASSDILLLPYDSEVYALRGSAVYQEGVAFGRPVVCTSLMGVSDLVMRYGNGLLAASDNEFAEKINELASRPKQEIEQMVTGARQAYKRDFEAGLQHILKGLGE